MAPQEGSESQAQCVLFLVKLECPWCADRQHPGSQAWSSHRRWQIPTWPFLHMTLLAWLRTQHKWVVLAMGFDQGLVYTPWMPNGALKHSSILTLFLQ